MSKILFIVVFKKSAGGTCNGVALQTEEESYSQRTGKRLSGNILFLVE